MKAHFATLQSIGRAGLPGDIARAALWLASDDASFVNGHNLLLMGTFKREDLDAVSSGYGANRHSLDGVSRDVIVLLKWRTAMGWHRSNLAITSRKSLNGL